MVQSMDLFREPRPNHRLCSAIREGNLLSIQQAVQGLEEAGWPVTLSRAMATGIETTNIPALLLLLRYGEVDEEVAEAAGRSGNIYIVRVVLDHGWSMDRALGRGSMPSILSFATSDVDFLDQLLDLGADPNAESNIGETALSFAVREGTMNVIRRLIAAGADVTRGDLLHCTSRREPSEDIYELVTMLIHCGAPLDTYQWDNERAKQMRYGYPQGTALHSACEEENYPAAEALLRYGADPHRLTKRGEQFGPPSPLEITRPESEMRSLLERYAQAQETEGRSSTL